MIEVLAVLATVVAITSPLWIRGWLSVCRTYISVWRQPKPTGKLVVSGKINVKLDSIPDPCNRPCEVVGGDNDCSCTGHRIWDADGNGYVQVDGDNFPASGGYFVDDCHYL